MFLSNTEQRGVGVGTRGEGSAATLARLRGEETNCLKYGMQKLVQVLVTRYKS